METRYGIFLFWNLDYDRVQVKAYCDLFISLSDKIVSAGSVGVGLILVQLIVLDDYSPCQHFLNDLHIMIY